jgi:TonB family protein
MTAIGNALAGAWVGVAVHLWQTTLVLVPLVALGWLVRNPPHKLTSAIAWLGLAKMMIPISLVAPLVERLAAPWLHGPVALGRVSGILYPGVLLGTTEAPHASSWTLALLVLTAAWVAGALRLGVQPWLAGSRSLGKAVPIEALSGDARVRLSSALKAIGISPARVRIVAGSGAPCVVGVRRPRIELPLEAVTRLPEDELRGILLHEQAHLRRLDPWTGVFLGLAGSVLYFYPPLWIVSRWLRDSAEYACDEAAVLAGVSPAVFTRAVSRMLSLELDLASGPTISALHRSSSLRARFTRLDQPWRFAPMTRHRIVLAVAVAATVVGCVAVALLADTGSTKPQAQPAQPASSQAPGALIEDLDTMPELLSDSYVAPKYPEDAKKAGAEGRVLLEAMVKADGTVAKAVVLEDVAACPEFGANAVTAVSQWKFKPATKDGKAIGVWVKIPVAYTLSAEKKVVPRPGASSSSGK